MEKLKSLFERCLNAEYTHTAEGGDYAIIYQGDTLYLLFECSDGKEDWKNNFDFPVKPYKQMNDTWLCHGGFFKVWSAMRDEIEEKVRLTLQFNPQIKNITCVGYSHGGPLSVLATEDMEYLYGKDYEVSGYGFGSPRVLWGVIPNAVKYRLRRFTTIRNIPDIVTHLPPKFLGFRDAGVILEVGEKGKYTPIKAHYADAYITEIDAMKGDTI